MILGDGYLNRFSSKSNSRLSLGHSVKQESYCIFKFELLNKYLNLDYSVKKFLVTNKKNGRKYPVIQGSTKVSRYLTKIHKITYDKNKRKFLSQKLLSYLDERGLAIWYMDDGGLKASHSRRALSGSFISTQNFNYEENLLIKNWFLQKFDIKASIHKHGHGKFRISFSVFETKKLISLIKPYIIKELEYKVCETYEDYVQLSQREKGN